MMMLRMGAWNMLVTRNKSRAKENQWRRLNAEMVKTSLWNISKGSIHINDVCTV